MLPIYMALCQLRDRAERVMSQLSRRGDMDLADSMRADISLANAASVHLTYRHKKTGGLYLEIARGRMARDLEPVVIYRSVSAGTMWVRPASEFDDGRFELVTPCIPGSGATT